MTDKRHITEIVKLFGNRLRGFIRKRVNSAEDAEDILQDVFYQLAEADYMMKPIEQMSAWLYTVARNRITDWYRKKKAEPISEFYPDDEEDDMMMEMNNILASTDNSPDTEYLRSLIWKEMETALAELPEEQCNAFVLNELEGMSFKEIAQMTDEIETTLISRKRYAVLHLRKRLHELYEELINF
ncbi:MAG: sigma-70 family RNA polymerase sigma factor [Breznakibacter sp.]